MLERLTALPIDSPEDAIPHLKQHKYPARKDWEPGIYVDGSGWSMPPSAFDRPRYFANMKQMKGSAHVIKRMSHELSSVNDAENGRRLHRLEINHFEDTKADPDHVVLMQEDLREGRFVEPMFAAALGLRRYLNAEVQGTTHIARRWGEIAKQEYDEWYRTQQDLADIWEDIELNGPLLTRSIDENTAPQHPVDA